MKNAIMLCFFYLVFNVGDYRRYFFVVLMPGGFTKKISATCVQFEIQSFTVYKQVITLLCIAVPFSFFTRLTNIPFIRSNSSDWAPVDSLPSH